MIYFYADVLDVHHFVAIRIKYTDDRYMGERLLD